MGTYNIPRNTKGEGRILMIFSTKALIYTAVGVGIGFVLWRFVFTPMNLSLVGLGIMVFLALLGFGIATFKIPDSDAFEITKNAGRIKHRWNNNKAYKI